LRAVNKAPNQRRSVQIARSREARQIAIQIRSHATVNPNAIAATLLVADLRLYCRGPMPIFDVTVPIRSTMPIYEGDPGVKVEPWSALVKGDSANVSFLHLGAHTGTHVDAPAHFIEGARRIDALPLEVLIGPARVVHVPDEIELIDLEFITHLNV